MVQAARRGVVALVMLVAAGCTGGDPAPPPGAPATIGVLAAAGSPAAHGAQLAVDVVNGLVPEAPFPLVAALRERRGALALAVASPGTTGAEAQQAVTRLVTQDRVAGIVLAAPGRVVEAAERADGHQVPLVDASSSAVRLNDLGFDWYFRTAPSDRMLAAAALSTLVPERRSGSPPRLAIIAAASAAQGGDGPATLLRELSAGSGVADVVTVVAQAGPGGARRTAGELARAEPEMVVAVAPDADAARAQLQAAVGLGSQVRLLGLGPGFAGSVAFSDEHPYLLRAASWSAEFANRQPVAREVALLYRARFGEPMSEPAASAFTAAMTLAIAVNAAGTTRAGEVRGALHQLWLPATQTIMPWDGVRFGPGGQNTLASGVVEQRVGKAFRVVYPPELAIAPPAAPLSG
ncbi:MAG TPA: hypothetical protein VFM55_16365 [Micromonosporaceae bacterium]|nr:hypothetical protein [Micromonosporaceae bacterium]